jgi:hypothetical protein
MKRSHDNLLPGSDARLRCQNLKLRMHSFTAFVLIPPHKQPTNKKMAKLSPSCRVVQQVTRARARPGLATGCARQKLDMHMHTPHLHKLCWR